MRSHWDNIFRRWGHQRARNAAYRYGITSHLQARLLVGKISDSLNYLISGGVKLFLLIAESNVERKASKSRDKTISIDNSTAGLALAEYSSLLITDALAGILGEGK